MRQTCRASLPLLMVALFFCSLPVFAQHPTPRLNGTIHETARLALAGSSSPQTRAAQDLGELSPGTPVAGITLVFKRSPEQESALKDLLNVQQDPASPQYRHWLTPEAFAARFGIADQDIAMTQAWLTEQGFHLGRVSRARDRITFSGTAAQVQSAFGTPLHHYVVQGERHFAPSSDLTLPAELAAITSAVLHLEDFRPRPNVKTPARIHLDPNYTTLSTQTHYLSPFDIDTMYDLNPLVASVGYGKGQGIAVVGQSYVNTSASSGINTFKVEFSALNASLTPVLVPGSGVDAISPGDEGESEIDLEYASGIANSANIFLVYVGDSSTYSVFDSLSFAIEENIAPVITISYGECESLISQSFFEQGNQVFEQAGAQGQTIVASSGDTGSTACSPYTAAGEATLAEQQALAVNYPADSPYVTAVGGTQMAAGTYTAGASTYWASATNFDNLSSLLSYVPEVVWNENTAERDIVAGGGGTSTYFTRPTWQTGVPGIPSGAFRLVPDISLQSSIQAPGYVICTSDSYLLDSQAQSCTNGLEGSSGQYTTAGGTSFAAPIFAGFLAILNQAQHTTGLGNINPTLYKLAANSNTYATAFHDITSGTNACTAGIGTCASAGESSYAATTGYDEATGLGSVDFNALATAWPASATASLTNTETILVGSPNSASPGTPVGVVIYIFPLIPIQTVTASGSVSILIDGVSTGAPLALTPLGTANPGEATTSYNFTAPETTGSHLVTVNYLGDSVHAPSTATFSFLVGDAYASGGLTLSAANLTVANNSSSSTVVTVTPTSGYHGQVVWSLSATTTGTTALSGCYVIDSVAVSAVTTAKLVFGTGTACNSALPAARRTLRVLPSHALNAKQDPTHGTIVAIAMSGGLVLCGLFSGRRRRRLPVLLSLLSLLSAAVLAIGLSGCGSGASTSASSSSTTPATYTLTLTATDSVNTSIAATTPLTLTVN